MKTKLLATYSSHKRQLVNVGLLARPPTVCIAVLPATPLPWLQCHEVVGSARGRRFQRRQGDPPDQQEQPARRRRRRHKWSRAHPMSCSIVCASGRVVKPGRETADLCSSRRFSAGANPLLSPNQQCRNFIMKGSSKPGIAHASMSGVGRAGGDLSPERPVSILQSAAVNPARLLKVRMGHMGHTGGARGARVGWWGRSFTFF